MRLFIQALEDFGATVGPKGRWLRITSKDLADDPDLLQNVFDMLTTSYEPIGGHANFKTAKDLIDGGLEIYGIDVSGDGEADAFTIDKEKPAGKKAVAGGSDGTRPGKDAYIDRRASTLKKSGFYAEMSGAIAHVMLQYKGVQAVTDQASVERVLGKKVKWVGAHPHGKYPGQDGWYSRSIGGDTHLKIMLGMPKGVARQEPKQNKPPCARHPCGNSTTPAVDRHPVQAVRRLRTRPTDRSWDESSTPVTSQCEVAAGRGRCHAVICYISLGATRQESRTPDLTLDLHPKPEQRQVSRIRKGNLQ